MTPTIRYVVVVFGVMITLYYVAFFSPEGYGRTMSLSTLTESLRKDADLQQQIPEESPNATTFRISPRKANAALVVLARNSDLKGVLESMKHMENTFNKRFQYPWVFLNEEPFSEDFKKYTAEVTSSSTTYGLVPRDHWVQPHWIDEERATKSREKMVTENVIYGGSVPYRNMCRYNSGFFWRHEILKDYDYYWRVEPNVQFYCDLDYDPFLLMKDQNKVYGFTISLYEYLSTIPTLWETTKAFIKQHPEYLSEDNAMAFLSSDGGESYNLCHFWSNFEIGDLNFWRAEAYSKYFDYLEKSGGFYYERWGDAPVHSIAAALFARKDQIHFFDDIGYRHAPFEHCPQGEAHARGKCWCDVKDNFDYNGYSCHRQYQAML